MSARSPLVALLALVSLACGGPLSQELELEASSCEERTPLPAGASDPFTLVNAYFLQEEATRALRRGESSSAVVEEVLSEAALMGVGAVRTWAFNDDPAKLDSAIQLGRLQYDETALRGLDLVLAAAHRHGLKLILPLGNYWNDYGGARQYVAWANLPDPVEGDPRFFTDLEVRAHYRAHVANLLQRVSSVDGLRYGEHPAVLAWELLNEPRLDPVTSTELGLWASDVAAVIRTHAPGHLVGSGEEGGVALSSALLGVGELDVGSLHLFPESLGWDPLQVAALGAQYIQDQAELLHDAGRPIWLGEFGLRNREGSFSLEERRAMYRGWLACARKAGLAAAGPWMFADDARPDDWDPHTFYLRAGTSPEDAVNRYAHLLIEAGTRWAAESAARRKVAAR